MSDDNITFALWFEERSGYTWPEDTVLRQEQRWREAWNAGANPGPLRYGCDLGQPPAAEAVADPRELHHGMHRLRVAPFPVTDEPTKPVLAEPTDREPWPAHLLVALFTKSMRDLRGKSLTEIASKKVPRRITENEIAMALNRTKPNRKSIQKMGLILMSEDATSAAVAEWKLRAAKMKDSDTDYELPPDHQIGQQLGANRLRIAA